MEGSSIPFLAASYNIRFDTPKDGERQWPNRRDAVADLLRDRCRIDVVGLQEVRLHQLEDLIVRLPDCDWVGVGRNDGWRGGEFTPIFYRRDRFQLLQTNTFWLSETPESPGSRSWDAQLTRIVTWAKFEDSANRAAFCFFNTHLEYEGAVARREGARLLKSKIPALSDGLPVIVTGDFNCTEASEPYRLLTREPLDGSRLMDARYVSRSGHRGPTASTTEGFAQLDEPETRIDYIFVNEGFAVLTHRIADDRMGSFFPSDHLPVVAQLADESP